MIEGQLPAVEVVAAVAGHNAGGASTRGLLRRAPFLSAPLAATAQFQWCP